MIIRIFIVFGILSVFSCKKYIDMDIIDKGRKPVLNAIIIADSFPTVKLYASKHILDESNYTKITDANVHIWLNDSMYSLYYSPQNEVYTNTSILLQENKQVAIKALTSLGSAEGKTIIPYKVPILSCDTFPRFSNEGIYIGFEIRLKFKDDANKSNYYVLKVESYNQYPTYEEINHPGIEIINDKLFMEDISFDGKIKIINILVYRPEDLYNQGRNIIKIYLMHVDEHLYKYMLSSNKQQYSGNSPFSEPVFVYSNIKNGFGICGSMNVSSVEISY